MNGTSSTPSPARGRRTGTCSPRRTGCARRRASTRSGSTGRRAPGKPEPELALRVEPWPRPDWSPLPHAGVVGVDGKVLLREPDFFVAMLRFAPDATIHEHPGPNDTHVVCLEGEGWTSVAGERAQIRAGERTFWPHDVPHRLWTEGTAMTTLMVERVPAVPEAAPRLAG